MYKFKKGIPIYFTNEAELFTQTDYEASLHLHYHVSKINLILREVDLWEKVDIYLNDGRVVRNVFLFNNNELHWSVSLNPKLWPGGYYFYIWRTINDEFSFTNEQITLINLRSYKSGWSIFNVPIDDEITFIEQYTTLPSDKSIIFIKNKSCES
jgi:hypothetical protein